MKTTDAAVRLAISQFLPHDVTYVKAMPIVEGSGRFKRKTPRRIGHTADHMFQVEIYGKPERVHKLKFLTLADNPPVALARCLTAVKGVLHAVMPDYEQWDDLVAEIQHGRDATIGAVRATFQQLTPEMRVLFVVVG